METRNVDWSITAGLDGKMPDTQVTHALLIDIRETARSAQEAVRSIRKMMLFFTVLVVIDCVALFIWFVAKL
jgi:hypothetical protein